MENCCIEFADHIFRDHTNIFCLKSGFLVCPFPIPITISPLTDFGLKFPGSHHPDLLPFYQFTLQVLQRISKSFLLKNSWKIQKLSFLWCTVESLSAQFARESAMLKLPEERRRWGESNHKGYYFYSPQSSTVIKSKMVATTILRTRTRFCPPTIRLHCRLGSGRRYALTILKLQSPKMRFSAFWGLNFSFFQENVAFNLSVT